MPIKDLKDTVIISTSDSNLDRFSSLPKKYVAKLSKSYLALKNISARYIRKLAVHQIYSEYRDVLEQLSYTDKEELVAQREEQLILKIKSGCTTTIALIFGISLGG
tara:strand:- start:409 stop:726 length:318 start_codon:yes stop_codon:yes gene_type:complete